MKTATFLFGLPCSGKTYWYSENYVQFKDHEYINADEIKKNLDGYSELREGEYVKTGITLAKEAVLKVMKSNKDLVMDAGGINNNYTISLMEAAFHRGYKIHLIFLDTPYWICLERNKSRDRKVPEQLILDKEVKKLFHWNRLINRNIVDTYEIIPYFHRTHYFFDMDGVMAAQIGLPVVNGKIDFVNSRYFRYLPVVPQVQKRINSLIDKGFNVYVLSASPTSFSSEEKLAWLEEHFPRINKANVFFVSQGRYKAEMFHDLHKRLKLNKRDMCLIEDTHAIIKETQRDYKMDAIHISEFLTYKL